MKLAIIDFQAILYTLNSESLHTKTFEIYFDICRLLDIDISREACFRLYTRHNDNYGKLKQYLCAMGKDKDISKKKFDEEFVRRYKQLYITKDEEYEQKKSFFLDKLKDLSNEYLIVLIGIGNIDFINIVIANLDLAKYINNAKLTEYLLDYPNIFSSVIDEYSNTQIEDILFIVSKYQQDIITYFSNTPPFSGVTKRFQEGI